MIYISMVTVNGKKVFAIIEARTILLAFHKLIAERNILAVDIHSIEEYDPVTHEGITDYNFKHKEIDDTPF